MSLLIIDPYRFNQSSDPCVPITNTTTQFISGGGTALHYVPVSYYYNWSFGCLLLRAEELGAAKQFTGLELSENTSRRAGLSVPRQYVKMYHTTANLMESSFSYLGSFGVASTLVGANPNMPVTDETLCFTGTWVKSAGSGWKAMNFNANNFCYNGTDNVLIFWVNDWGSYDTNNYPRWNTSSVTADVSRGAYDYDDVTEPTTVRRSDVRPHLKLKY